MKPSLLDELRNESEKDEPLVPRTVRMSKEIDQEMKEFCGNHQIRFSVLVRRVIEEGWRKLSADQRGDV